MTTTNTATPRRRIRMRSVAAAFAALAVGGTTLIAAGPAVAADSETHGAPSWHSGVILETDAFAKAFLPEGFVCMDEKSGKAFETDLTIRKSDEEGTPIAGVSFLVQAVMPEEANANRGQLIDLASWNEARDRDLEQQRFDLLEVRNEASVAWTTAHLEAGTADRDVASAQETLDTAGFDLRWNSNAYGTAAAKLMQAELWVETVNAALEDPAWTALGDEAWIRAEHETERIKRGTLTVEEAQVAMAEQEAIIEAELEPLRAALEEAEATAEEKQAVADELRVPFDEATAAHDEVALQIADLLHEQGQMNDWVITTDENGVANIELVGCTANAGGQWTTGALFAGLTITEVDVPEGIDPSGIGESVTIDRGGTLLDETLTPTDAPLDSEVFTSVEAEKLEHAWADIAVPGLAQTPEATVNEHVVTIDAVNSRLPEEPPVTTPPTVEPPVTTPPTETPDTPAKAVPPTVRPPVVSG